MLKKYFSQLMIASLLFTNTAFAASNYTYTKPQSQLPVYGPAQSQSQYAQNNTIKGSIVMVPAGVSVPALMTTELSSATATAGQAVNMSLSNDFYYSGKLIAPAGSTVYGTVIEAVKAKHGSMNGKLCVRFTQIYTPYGTQIPITAVIKTSDSSGVLVGGTKKDVAKEYTKDVVVGTAAGALSGVVFGALAGGSVGQGAALGTAVGAGGGLVKSIWDKGNDVTIPANASVDIMLTQPLTTGAAGYALEN